MRLTLRTLLAYLDDVLDPADKEELSQKIESSDFAEDLVHRTRDAVRRLRLSAPQVVGSGMGLDPNSVAEYLDNVMPPDAVGDFERICLESDVHLAEAAACHHVLTMVLGQPADVDPLARQRMYTIATEAGERKRLRMEPAHTTQASSAASVAPGQLGGMRSAAPQPRPVEIPEYLRTSAWWRSWVALAGLAAVVLIGIAILLGTGLPGWFGKGTSVALLTPDSVAPTAESGSPNEATATEQAESNTPSESMATAPTDTAAAAALSSPPQPLNPAISPTGPPQSTAISSEPDRYPPAAPPQPSSAIATTPPSAAPSLGGATSIAAATANPGAATNPVNTGAIGPTLPGNPTVNVPSTPAGPPSAAATNPPLPPQPNATVPPATGAAATAPAPGSIAANATPAVPAPPAANAKAGDKPPISPELGTYLGGKTVLLRYDGKTGAWFRVEPRAAVLAGERLLALPEFRPKIALVSGFHLDISGGTQVVMGSGNETKPDGRAAAAGAEIPMVELVYGRLVFINSTNGENRLRLKLGPNTGEAQLARNSTLAVEVERKHVPGQDPRQAPAPIECRLFAPDGGVVWKDGAGSKTVEKPSRWTVSVAGATEPVADPAPPEWIDREPIVQLSEQRYGAPVIESTLVSNVPADTQLLEIFQSSGRKEVKSLVASSSIHVGLFVPFIDALRDSEQKANWKRHIDTLRAAMALSPDSANKVWEALVAQRGRPAAGDLYEMLCGYNADQIGHTPDQVKTGAVAKLINWLESDSLDYRVLAVQDLKEITGKQLMSNPAANLAERTQNVRRWRARLDAGELKPVSQPQ